MFNRMFAKPRCSTLLAAPLALCLLSAPTPAGAQADVLGGLTLGVFLNHLMSQLQDAINAARNAANGVAIEAGTQAVIVVQQAQNSYQEELDKTADKLDSSVLKSTDQLNSLVQDAIKKTGETAADIERRGQTIVDTLPFRNAEPQVSKVTPAFVVPKDNATSNDMEIVFEGNFPNSSKQGYEPVLTVGGKTYQSHNQTQSLTFLVPEGDLFPNTAATPDKINFASVNLILPWDAPRFFGLFDKRLEDHFNVLIGALPSYPGKVVVTNSVAISTHNTKQFCSGNFHQCSDGNCGNNDDLNHVWSVTPESGWHVVRGSSHTGPVTAHGQVSGPSFLGDDGDHVRYVASTVHKSWGSSGVLDFSICFTEYQDVPGTSTHTSDPIMLRWGESKAFDYPPGTWMVTFTDFTGTTNQWRDKGGNKFLSVTPAGNGLSITATDPDHVDWP